MIRVLSLGAGVQSTTLALMAACGEIAPAPDCAIFADTGEEPAGVYKHLAWLMESGRLPFPVHVVRAWEGYGRPNIKASLGTEILNAARGQHKPGAERSISRGMHSRPPFFTLSSERPGYRAKQARLLREDEEEPEDVPESEFRAVVEAFCAAHPAYVIEEIVLPAKRGMIRRQCTGDYKIEPIEKKLRELLGLRRGQRWPRTPTVEQWVGISTDEATRIKPSQRPAITIRWPLIELGMSRADCLAWLRKNGHPEPPKSACTFCPFHSDDEWRRIRDTDPTGWARAVEIDEAIRHGLTTKGLTGALFLHSSATPLRLVDLSTAEDHGQMNLFDNECTGMCGS